MGRNPSNRGGVRAAIRNRAVFTLLTVGLSFIAMIISFTMIGWLIDGMEEEPSPDPMNQRRAILLRGFSNDLTMACNDYRHYVVSGKTGILPDAREWIERVFRRDIRFLEQRMDDNPMTGLPAFVQLRTAVHRCAGMARHPDDGALRSGAMEDALRAIEVANAYIATIDMARHAGPSPVRIEFD